MHFGTQIIFENKIIGKKNQQKLNTIFSFLM